MKVQSKSLMAAALATAFVLAAAAAQAGNATKDQELAEEKVLATLNNGSGPKTAADCGQFITEKVQAECKKLLPPQ
jgi:hypothetical protein